ncbi:MAG: rhomboid family intramembrane serine protease [Pseudomonadota bacterium]
MFLPLRDNNPLQIISFQWVTVTLIAVNVAIFLFYQFGAPTQAEHNAMFGYGVIPAVLFDHRELTPDLVRLPEELTLISYQFFHGGWMHLISNMAFLWVFGDNVEDSMGHIRFGIFYIACGIFAGLAHALSGPQSESPLIGASGAVSGVLAAYMILHPRRQVWVLIFMRIPVPLPAVWAIGAWIVFQFFSLAMDEQNAKESVAWWAHIGGFAVGIPLLFLLAPGSLRRTRELRELEEQS